MLLIILLLAFIGVLFFLAGVKNVTLRELVQGTLK